MKNLYALLFSILLCSTLAVAQSPALIKNINTLTTDVFSSSFPGKGAALNGYFYFPATNYNGSELWRTDGTASGTAMIKDLESIFDRSDANPRMFMPTGDSMYFFARNGFHLYKYKPSTNEITEMAVGKDNAYTPTEAVVIGDNIFFASDWYYNQGVELLRYNIVTTSLDIYDVSPDTFSAYPVHLTAVGDSLFFSATDTTYGRELWMYDPNIDNVVMVQDIAPGLESSYPSDLVAYNNKLFFTAGDTVNYGNELWVSDGSGAGTFQYSDINFGLASSNPAHKVVFNNQLFFSADDGAFGNELWMVDDINSTMGMLVDINGFGDSNPGIHGFKQAGPLLYFAADDGNDGEELWSTDGTASGTAEVADINSFGSSYPLDMYNLGDTLIFAANDGGGWQIWQSLGTSSSTSVIQNIQPPGYDTIRICGVFNGRVYFGADDGTHGVELWKTGGHTSNTSMVKDINYGAAINSDPLWFEPFNSNMYFAARTNGDYYFSLFKTDGTSIGTIDVKHGSIINDFSVGGMHGTVLGSNMIFSAYTSATGFELWKTNGTTTGTVAIADINPGTTGSDPNYFTVIGTDAFFIADDGTHGPELWKTDGTSSGTVLVKDINSGTAGSEISDFTVVNGKLVFSAIDGVHGREMWVSNGTSSGTVMLNDIHTGAPGSSPSQLYSTGSLVYFVADDGATYGNEVWITDGTVSGTTMLADINVGSDPSNAGSFAQLGSWVYFSATDVTNQETKLWRTDGTAANTSLFYNVNFPFLMTNVGTKLVFMAFPSGSTNGFHMWSTNGTTAGTSEIEDFMPGTVGYFILDKFPTYNGHVFFWIDDNISGQELWASDGTIAGTVKHDIAPGPSSSYPRNAAGLNPLIFSADDGSINGREPWSLAVTPTTSPLPITGLHLTADKRESAVLLQWKTFSEHNNSGFEVQRSSNGTSYDSIGFVYPASSTGAQYSLADLKPGAGRNYYRIRQLDNDGKWSYSNVCVVDFNTLMSVKAYPNPASEMLTISSDHTFTEGQVTIRSLSGQFILQQPVSGSGPINVSVKQLANGVYNAEVSEGAFSFRLMFVKQ